MKKVCIAVSMLFVFALLLSLFLILMNRELPIGEKVAIVRVEGPIVSSGRVIEELRDYAKDPSVKAVVLRVESPGGAVAPSQEIYEEVKKLREKKPVIVSMGSVAASGGYYISAPATRIYANPGTITGSIGVIMEIPNVKELMDRIGVRTEVIKSGKHKDLASAFRGVGKEERKILQSVLDEVHGQFIRAVSEGRELDIEKVRKIADGRIFTGSQAVKLGLVDDIGNMEDAVRAAADLGGIKGEPHRVEKKEKSSILDYIAGKIPDRMKGFFQFVQLKYMMYY
jgi:protease-4